MGRITEQTFFQKEMQMPTGTFYAESDAHHQGNANQNPREVTSHLSEWLSSKRTQRPCVGKDIARRKGNPSTLLVGM